MERSSLIDCTDAIVDPGKSFLNYEFFHRALGGGINGWVFLGRNKKTKKLCALKQLDYSELAVREFNFHYRLSASEYVVDILDVYIEKFTNGMILNLIMECMEGGSLFTYLNSHKISEKLSVNMAYQIAKAIQFLHRQNIAHRDLKPENILLTDCSSDPKLKLGDFGHAKFCHPFAKTLITPVGTTDFIAPEIAQGEDYDLSCDIWSFGVLIYSLFGGNEVPFPKKRTFPKQCTPNHCNRILNSAFLQDYRWQAVSASPKDLIRKLLVTAPDLRPTIDQVLEHKCFKNRNNSSEIISKSTLDLEEAVNGNSESIGNSSNKASI